MAITDNNLLEDASGVKVPQYYNVSTDNFEETEGSNGAPKARVEDGHDVTGGTQADPVAGADLSQDWTRISLLKAAVTELRSIDTIQGANWHTGSGAPSDGLGADGDFYLDGDNGDYYEKVSGSWSLEGNLQGPAGAGGGESLTISADNTTPTTSDSVTFTISGDTGDLSIWWLDEPRHGFPLDNVVNEGGTTQEYTFPDAGTYFVRCVGSDSTGGPLLSGIVKIVVS